jgi:MFS family permease
MSVQPTLKQRLHTFIRWIKKPQIHLPIKVRFVSVSVFLFMIGWGLGTDTYFSIYVQSIIGNGWGITAVGTILALAKLLFVIPVGNINDHANIKYILLLGKVFYVICALLYFLAGTLHSPSLLIIATILNGFASATTFTTYRSYYGKNANRGNHSQVFGAYFSSNNIAQIVGALISAALVYYLELPFMYFFVAIFALISLLQDQKIKTSLSKHYNRTWKKLYKRAQTQLLYEADEGRDSSKTFLGKGGFVRTFFKECFSLAPRKRIINLLKVYNAKMYVALGSMFLVNLLNYIGFLFIPIVSIENNLNLSQIAIVFAVMKLPYLITIFIGKLGDKYNKKLLISIILVFISLFYIFLGIQEDFLMILLLTFAISMGIAMLNPITSALVSSYTHQKDKGVMTGAQDFISKMGEVVGSLGFGALTALIGIKTGFIVIGISVFVLGIYLFAKKMGSYYHKNNERETKSEREVHDL